LAALPPCGIVATFLYIAIFVLANQAIFSDSTSANTMANTKIDAAPELTRALRWSKTGIIEFDSEVSVLAGRIVDIKLGGMTPYASRQWGLAIATDMAALGLLKGFDKKVMELVAPRTPYKVDTRDHAEDEGLHVTVVQGYGRAKEDIPAKALQLRGRKHTVKIDTGTIRFLQGNPDHDEAAGNLFYVAADVDAATKNLVDELRLEMGLEKKQGFFPHVSLAGIAPKGTRALHRIKQLRADYAPPFPTDGSFPKPIHVIMLNITRGIAEIQI
jgi:hypothetical protein